jgi:hypothetical protein
MFYVQFQITYHVLHIKHTRITNNLHVIHIKYTRITNNLHVIHIKHTCITNNLPRTTCITCKLLLIRVCFMCSMW